MTNTSQGAASECECHQLRRAGSFSGAEDFQEFSAALQQARMEEVPVAKKYMNVGEAESWHRCSTCHGIWRLIEPDAPFAGIWERVGQ